VFSVVFDPTTKAILAEQNFNDILPPLNPGTLHREAAIVGRGPVQPELSVAVPPVNELPFGEGGGDICRPSESVQPADAAEISFPFASETVLGE
jgi:hypothetical protein